MASAAGLLSIPVQTHQAKKSFYRPELDVLRFFAFLLVFVHHMLPHSPADYSAITRNARLQTLIADAVVSLGSGLCLFFLLSAFLIATLLIKEKADTGGVHVRSFYIRRMLRIWPLYALAIGLSFLLSKGNFWHVRVPGYLPYVLMIANLGLIPSSGVMTYFPVPHLWSISVEEQFYVLFPGIAKRSSLHTLGLFGMGLIAGSLIALKYCAWKHLSGEGIWLNTFVQFSMFGFGVLLAVYYAKKDVPNFSMPARISLFLLGLAMCFAAQHFCRYKDNSASFAELVMGYMLVAVGCSLFLLSLLGERRLLPRSMIYLGKISYGLYVFHAFALGMSERLVLAASRAFHLPLGSLAQFIMKDFFGFALTIILAMISYRFFEKPFLRLKDSFAFVKSRPA